MLTNPAFSSLVEDHYRAIRSKRIGTVYNGYRMLIASFFSLNFFLVLRGAQENYWAVINFLPTFGYLLISVLIFIAYHFNPKNHLLMAGLALDLLALTILLYFSGGTDLQVILLFLVEVAASFMLVRTNQAILLTIFAITLVMYQPFFQTLQHDMTYTLLSNVGLMTISFIAVAYLSHTLAKRFKQIETLSERQKIEVNALNAINKKIVHIIDQGVLVVSHRLEVLIANDTALEQLRLPTSIDDYHLSTLLPPLAQRLAPLVDEDEASLILRLPVVFDHTTAIATLPPPLKAAAGQAKYPSEQITHYSSFVDFRIRLTQLGNERTLLLIEDLRREQSHAQQLKLASLGQLTASIAHEIRNPLAAISQASQLLIETSQLADSLINADDQLLFEMIYKQTKRVNQIIEDVLNLSRQQKPNQVLIQPKIWLKEFLHDNFAEHKVLFHCYTDHGLLFDNYQLEQVMVNLINNGLRFSGKVQLHASVMIDMYEAGKYLYLDIIDQGTGVAPKHVGNLFNPFFTTDHQGTGLGLYLSQAFCQANHANLLYVPTHANTCFRIICAKKPVA